MSGNKEKSLVNVPLFTVRTYPIEPDDMARRGMDILVNDMKQKRKNAESSTRQDAWQYRYLSDQEPEGVGFSEEEIDLDNFWIEEGESIEVEPDTYLKISAQF